MKKTQTKTKEKVSEKKEKTSKRQTVRRTNPEKQEEIQPQEAPVETKQPARQKKPRKPLTLEEKQEIRLRKHQKRLRKNKEYLQSRSEENFYCTNKQLIPALERWRDTAPLDRPQDRVMTKELADMVERIAKKLTNHSNFIRYPWHLKEEMVSYAKTKILMGLKSYNFKFSNPFSYITQSCWNSFLIVLRKHYKQLNIKRELMKYKLSQIEENKQFSQKNLYNYLTRQFLGEVDQDSDEGGFD